MLTVCRCCRRPEETGAASSSTPTPPPLTGELHYIMTTSFIRQGAGLNTPESCVCFFREFDVQAEVRGQVAGPVWSSQLSPDSACSEGSAGSVEQQQDAGQCHTCSHTHTHTHTHTHLSLTCVSCGRHGLSEPGQLCGQSGFGGRRRQELSEEPLRHAVLQPV